MSSTVLAYIFGAIDSSKVTLLALFDISAAFDTVDHSILLERLSTSFGISDGALLWLRSYLSDRSLSVVFGSNRSGWAPLPYGLPQGSVLAPFFSFYTLSNLAASSLLLALPLTSMLMTRRSIFMDPLPQLSRWLSAYWKRPLLWILGSLLTASL